MNVSYKKNLLNFNTCVFVSYECYEFLQDVFCMSKSLKDIVGCLKDVLKMSLDVLDVLKMSLDVLDVLKMPFVRYEYLYTVLVSKLYNRKKNENWLWTIKRLQCCKSMIILRTSCCFSNITREAYYKYLQNVQKAMNHDWYKNWTSRHNACGCCGKMNWHWLVKIL